MTMREGRREAAGATPAAQRRATHIVVGEHHLLDARRGELERLGLLAAAHGGLLRWEQGSELCLEASGEAARLVCISTVYFIVTPCIQRVQPQADKVPAITPSEHV